MTNKTQPINDTVKESINDNGVTNNIKLSKEEVTKKVVDEYSRYSYKKIVMLTSFLIALFVIILITIHLGATDLSYIDIISIILHKGNSWNDIVVWNLRLPRLIAGIICGAVLGITGCVMQSILRNPLASPFTLGISGAAAFGAAVAILLSSTATWSVAVTITDLGTPLFVTISAFVCSMISVILILTIVKFTNSSPETIVLAGVAISSIFSALLSMIQYMANESTLASIVYWQFGSLDKVSWNDLAIMSSVSILAILYFYHMRWDYNAMEAGEDVAKSLGMDIKRVRIFGLIISAIAVSVIVSYVGIIGFVGLLGPHMVKRIVGNDNRYVLIGSMLVGAIIVLIASMIGTYAFTSVIPVGIITSAIGGPAFLIILIRRYKENASC